MSSATPRAAAAAADELDAGRGSELAVAGRQFRVERLGGSGRTMRSRKCADPRRWPRSARSWPGTCRTTTLSWTFRPSGCEIPDPVTFRSLRARLGVLLLLPSSDNASFNDAPYDEKIGYYSRHNRLAAIFDPKNQRRNPSVRNFVAKNGLGALFHSFGDHPEMMVVVESRGLLYQELCRQVWSAEAVGLPVPKAKKAQAQPETASSSQIAVPGDATTGQAKKAAAPRKATAGAPTQISKLVQAKVLGPEARLHGIHRGIAYTAHIDADGHIRLASGDHYRKPDDAARIAVGITSISGMAFWHVDGRDGQLVSPKDVFTQAQKNGQLPPPKSRSR